MAAEDISGNIGLDTTDWKTGVSQINKDVRVLESGFKAAAAGIDNWKQSADGLRMRNATLTDVIDKQQGKVALLEAEYGRLKDEAEANGDTTKATANALQDFEIKLNSAKEQLAKNETELRQNTTALGEMESADGEAAEGTKELTETAKDAEKQHKSFKDVMKDLGSAISGAFVASVKAATAAIAAVAAAIGTAITKAYGFATSAGEMADNVLTLSAQTGVSTQKLQEWEYAANFMDTPVETITKSMAKMVKNMGDAAGGSKTAQEKFSALGLSIYDTSGNLKNSETLFGEAMDALSGIANETERDAIAMDLFGKSAQDLNPLIQTGSEGLKALGEEAHKMGVVFSDESVAAMGKFDDSVQTMKATATGLTNTIGATVMPMFQPFVDLAATSMASISNAMKDGLQPEEFDEIMNTIFTTLETALADVTNIISGVLPYVVEGLNIAVSNLVTFIPTLIDTLIPAATALLQSLLDAIVANVEPLMTMAMTLITSIGQFIVENIPLLVDSAAQIITMLVTYISENATNLVAGATTIITTIIDGITALLPDLIPLAINMMVALAVALVNAIPEIAARLPEIVDAIFDGLAKVNWIQLGIDLINGLINGLTSAVSSLLEGIKNVFVGIWNAILGVFGIASPSTEAESAAGFILQGLLDGFESAVSAVCDAVKRIFGKIWDAIKSIFGFGAESEESKEAKTAGKDIMTGMQSGINDNKDLVENAVTNTSKDALKIFRTELGIPDNGGASTKTKGYGESLDKGIADGITSKGVTDTFNGAAQTASEAAGTAFNNALGISGTGFLGTGEKAASKFNAVGKAIAQGVANGIKDNASLITSAAKTAANNALVATKKALGIASPSKKAYSEIGAPFIQGIANALSDGSTALKDSVNNVSAAMTDIKIKPVTMDGSTAGGVTPVYAQLTLDGKTFGQLVVGFADKGQGFIASNMERLGMGVQIA